MIVSEIFHSISGEGIHAGIPTVFVRLAGCNLRCTYCDTQYAWDGGEGMTPTRIVDLVRSFGSKCRWTIITGGEPLFSNGLDLFELIRQLKGRYLIEIETNGSIDPPSWFKFVDCWSVDVKCPSSGPSYGTFRVKWFRKMRKQDQLKFVVGTREDLDFVRGFLNSIRIRPTILVSPVHKGELSYAQLCQPWLQEVAEFCKEQNVRMSLQLHKIIWGDRRGV